MNIQAEADRWYPLDHEVDDPFGETGVARSDPYGYNEYANRAFVAGAEWARKEALREAVGAILSGDYNRPEHGVLGTSKSQAYSAGKRSALNTIRTLLEERGRDS